ncbi:DUF4209 domain-containing protein [Leifsonia sp. LS-T14]|uniref:DUF4209 domain-containing protein n=1 Tax=unclassified Leifsonia TaxID=2663824 RepID=UPI0035A6AD21
MADPTPSVDALNRLSWQPALEHDHATGSAMLYELASGVANSDPDAEASARALAGVFSMMLQPENWDAPFAPMLVFSTGRSALPSDLTDDELVFLEQLLESIDHPWLTARIADVLFVRQHDRSARYTAAKRAAEAYAGIELRDDPDRETLHGWRRGIELSARFRLEDVLNQLIVTASNTFKIADEVEAWRIAQAMRNAGVSRDEASEIHTRLATLGANTTPPHLYREIHYEAFRWAQFSGNLEATGTYLEKVGDSWWEEAGQRTDSMLVRRDFLGKAYAVYSSVPRKHRSKQTQTRLAELPRLIRETGAASLDEMIPVGSTTVDLTGIKKLAEQITEIPDPLDAIAAWFTAAPLEKYDDAIEAARKQAADHPLLNFIGRSTVTDDGRKIHSTGNRERLGLPDELWAQMVKSFQLRLEIVIPGLVLPVLNELSSQRQLTRTDFAHLVRSSPFVAPDQEDLWATAIHHGYYGRFTEALFILAPAIEGSVRHILHQYGIETRAIRDDDTEIETGLSALMDLDGADDIFDKDLAWNIRALFCGPIGPNLRNRVAHGLVTRAEAESTASIYAWFFAFRLAFVPYFNAVRGGAEAVDEASANGDAEDGNS